MQKLDINKKITRRGFLTNILPENCPKTLFEFSLMKNPFHLKYKKIGKGNKVHRRVFKKCFNERGNFHNAECEKLMMLVSSTLNQNDTFIFTK